VGERSSVAPKQRPEFGDYRAREWPQNSATWRNLACAPVWNWFQCMRFVQARRMATLHPQARIECIKTLLIDGRSRSEIGARLGLKRSVVCALVHRLKRDGVALPRSRPGPKPVIITPPKPVPAIAFEPLTATAAPLLELDDNACRWPVAGEGRTTLFCGAGRSGHPSYCRQHAMRSVVVETVQRHTMKTAQGRKAWSAQPRPD
jgi:hypothetical protein